MLLLVVSIIGCKDDEETPTTTSTAEEATILGRWVPEGFESNIRYEFTVDTRYSIYATNDSFPTLEEFKAENPELRGNSWEYSGDTVVIDLNFGNFSKTVPVFACENKVINWQRADSSEGSTYFREGHDLSSCR